jgi:hypothetical protein
MNQFHFPLNINLSESSPNRRRQEPPLSRKKEAKPENVVDSGIEVD